MLKKLGEEEKKIERFLNYDVDEIVTSTEFTKHQVRILLNSLSLKLKEKELREKIFQKIFKIQTWRRINKRDTRYLSKLLNEFSLEELRTLFNALFWEKDAIIEVNKSLRSLREALEILLRQGVEELRRFYLKRKFVKMILNEEFKKENAVFPEIRLKVKVSEKRIGNRDKTIIGEYKDRDVELWISNKSPRKAVEVDIVPKKFVKFYGWLFSLMIENKEYKTVFVKQNRRGFFLNMFMGKRILKDYVKGIDTKDLPVSPIRKIIGPGRSLYILIHNAKRLEVRLKNCTSRGDIIEIVPMPHDDLLDLEFYKIIDETRKFLRSYRLQRCPPRLIRLI